FGGAEFAVNVALRSSTPGFSRKLVNGGYDDGRDAGWCNYSIDRSCALLCRVQTVQSDPGDMGLVDRVPTRHAAGYADFRCAVCGHRSAVDRGGGGGCYPGLACLPFVQVASS